MTVTRNTGRPVRPFRYSGRVATSVLPSPVIISAMAPWWSTMPPTICTSWWRSPRVRTLASRTSAKAFGSTSSRMARCSSSSRPLRRSRQAAVSAFICSPESPLAQLSSALTCATTGTMARTTRSFWEPKAPFSQRPKPSPKIENLSLNESQSKAIGRGAVWKGSGRPRVPGQPCEPHIESPRAPRWKAKPTKGAPRRLQRGL